MSPLAQAYGALALAIISEVAASSFLQLSAQFSRPGPTAAMAVLYLLAFYLLAQALKCIPLGTAYAIWSGCGIILTAMISVFIFRFVLDLAALLGITLIVSGIVVMNVFSRSVGN